MLIISCTLKMTARLVKILFSSRECPLSFGHLVVSVPFNHSQRYDSILQIHTFLTVHMLAMIHCHASEYSVSGHSRSLVGTEPVVVASAIPRVYCTLNYCIH